MNEREPQFESNLASHEQGEGSNEQNNYDPQPTIDILKNKLRQSYLADALEVQNQLDQRKIDPTKAENFFARLDALSLHDLGYEISNLIPVEKAKELLGRNMVFGREEVKKAFGIELSETEVPKIPFSDIELKRAKELGQFLVLRTDKMSDGQPLTMAKMQELLQPKFDQEEKGKVLYPQDWYKTETFFTTETPQLQWALATKETIPNSKSKNYLQQTKLLGQYLTNLFKGTVMPKQYVEAIKEFTGQEKALSHLMGSDWQAASQKLVDLKLNQLTRQSPVEALYDELIYFQNNNQRILETDYTWTNARASDGDLVDVGGADAEGAGVNGRGPGDSSDSLGVSFSRSF